MIPADGAARGAASMALICIVSSWNNSLWLLLLICVGGGWPSRGVGATSLSCWGPALRLVSDITSDSSMSHHKHVSNEATLVIIYYVDGRGAVHLPFLKRPTNAHALSDRINTFFTPISLTISFHFQEMGARVG